VAGVNDDVSQKYMEALARTQQTSIAEEFFGVLFATVALGPLAAGPLPSFLCSFVTRVQHFPFLTCGEIFRCLFFLFTSGNYYLEAFSLAFRFA
jgi:hypothetical protein